MDLTRLPGTSGGGFRADIPIPKGDAIPQRKTLAMGREANQGPVRAKITGQPHGGAMSVKIPGMAMGAMGRTKIPGWS